VSGTDLEEIVRSADWDVDVSELSEEEAAVVDTDLDKPKKGRGQLEKEMLASTCASSASTTSIRFVPRWKTA
jgi:membrane protease subunit HflC